jgi:glycoprotein endo-alpha-1,2-mannosidase
MDYYPKLGTYSSSDLSTMDTHLRWISEAGIGTIIVSWWGAGSYEDNRIWDLLNVADNRGIKVGFYIEPYNGGYNRTDKVTRGNRTPQDAKTDVKYIIDTYGCHRAMYRRGGRPVFMFFAARTYMNGAQGEWKLAWDELHNNTNYNPIVIAHDLNLQGRIIAGGWDGGHDYDAFAASRDSVDWTTLASTYAAAKKIMYFTVAPGYDKTRFLPNPDPLMSRENGFLYSTLWLRAIAARRSLNPVIVCSFNEVSASQCGLE